MHSAMRSGGARLNLAKPGLVSDIRDAMLCHARRSRALLMRWLASTILFAHTILLLVSAENFLPDVDANAPLFLPKDARRFSAANRS